MARVSNPEADALLDVIVPVLDHGEVMPIEIWKPVIEWEKILSCFIFR